MSNSFPTNTVHVFVLCMCVVAMEMQMCVLPHCTHTHTHTHAHCTYLFPLQENLQEAPAENRHAMARPQQEPGGARGHRRGHAAPHVQILLQHGLARVCQSERQAFLSI